MAPDAIDILELMAGPELTSKGEWMAWFMALFVTAINVVLILFADELFQLRFAFSVQNPELIEPTDWEIGWRYIGWTGMTIMVLVFYIMGLQ